MTIKASITLPTILAAAGLADTLPARHRDTLVRQNLLTITLFTIFLFASEAFCGSILEVRYLR